MIASYGECKCKCKCTIKGGGISSKEGWFPNRPLTKGDSIAHSLAFGEEMDG